MIKIKDDIKIGEGMQNTVKKMIFMAVVLVIVVATMMICSSASAAGGGVTIGNFGPARFAPSGPQR